MNVSRVVVSWNCYLSEDLGIWRIEGLKEAILTSCRSSGDLVLQALLGSTSTTFTRDAVVETVLGFTGSMKDMELDRYEVDVLKMLVKREDVEITPDIRMLVMKRADRKTVEMFEREVPSPAEVSDMDMDRQLVAAASNMEHAPEIINYLLEKKKAITLTERLIDIAAERQEEIEPNIRGNLIMTSLFKSNVTVHLDEFENLLDTVVRDFNFATVEALLSMPNLTLKVTRFTLQAAVLNPHATKELLEMLLEYTGTPEANSDTGSEGRSLEATSEKMEPSLPTPSDNKTESLTITAVLGSSEDIVRTSLELQKVGDITIDPSAETVATQVPCSHAKPLEVKSASETLAPEDLANTLSDSVKPHRDVDSRVDEYVMTSAVSNVERGENLVRVLLGYCDASIITEQVLRAAISNRKQAFEILELLKNHAESDKPPMDSLDASPVTEKSEIPEKVETRASTTFWKPRITRRIFEAAMRNWTETGNNVLLQLLKNDLKAVLTQDMFLEIIRQHKLAVVKELFANHGSSFPMAEDTAEDILSHAAANWSSGVRVFRFVVDENKDLVAKIIPESEKIAEVVAGNWKSGKSVLDLLLRRFKLCVTEKVLLACAKNPYAGADIMKVLLRSYPGQVSTDVLKAAAENFGCGVPLLKLLLKRGEYTCLPDEVFQAACANGSCGHEILDFLADGNYAFNVSESALLACARNASPTRIFLVSPVTEGKEVPMTQDLLHQQREKKKNGNQLLKPPLQYGGIVCLVNMYASRWQECNVLWGLKNGVSEDETWVRREADWVWGTGRGILLDLLENHWIEGDFIPSSILDVAARNFDAEVIRAVLKLRDKPISEVALLNATSNELYAHEVVMTLLAEKRLLPPDSITPPVLISAASNPSCGRQLLGDLWTEKSEVTDALLHAAVGNPSQREQLVAFLLEKGGKVSTELFETAVHNASQGPMIKLLLEHSDDKKLVVTSKTITNAAENEMIGADLVEDFLKLNPAVEISDEALEAAARNRGCGAKVIKLLLTRKPLSEVKELDDILVSAAKNPEQVSLFLLVNSRFNILK
jgi:hypothetical protein